MGQSLYFSRKEHDHLCEALDLAERLTGRCYGIAAHEWKFYPYDIRTLKQLRREEVTDRGFAQLAKYSLAEDHRPREDRVSEFYRICVQDHVILQALHRRGDVTLRPLLLYVMTHELVHVVRFSRSMQDYSVRGLERQQEEKEVHDITYQLLKDVDYDRLEEVIKAYGWARSRTPRTASSLSAARSN